MKNTTRNLIEVIKNIDSILNANETINALHYKTLNYFYIQAFNELEEIKNSEIEEKIQNNEREKQWKTRIELELLNTKPKLEIDDPEFDPFKHDAPTGETK